MRISDWSSDVCSSDLIDRNDYWQCAYVFPKGGADRVRGQGLAHFHDEIAHANPDLAEAAKCIRSWDDVKLLSVTLDRLTRWYAPGILAIGDAAHAMSPLGGVGINLAIQDRSEEHTSELQSLMSI